MFSQVGDNLVEACEFLETTRSASYEFRTQSLSLKTPCFFQKHKVPFRFFSCLPKELERQKLIILKIFYNIPRTCLLNRLPVPAMDLKSNIPRTCLLNRLPVPAMDLKSNRSGLWRHMLAELVAGWEDYVADVQTMSRDMIKLQLSQHFCRATWVSCRVGVTLYSDFYTFRSCNTCTFSLTTFAVFRHTT